MVTAVTLDSGKVEYTDLPLVLPRQFRLYRAAASMCRTNGSGRSEVQTVLNHAAQTDESREQEQLAYHGRKKQKAQNL